MEENAEKLLLDHNITFGGIQPDGTARVIFTATPREWAPGQTASLSVLLNGAKVAEVPCTIDGAVCTAAVDLPLENGYEYHFVTTDGEGGQKFQYLDNGNCSYLKSDTTLMVECWVVPDADYRRNTLYVLGMELMITQPPLSVEFETVEWTQMDYVVSVNGREVCRESFLEADVRDSMEYSISESSRVFSGISLQNGDQVTLTIEVAISTGLSETITAGEWILQNGKLN